MFNILESVVKVLEDSERGHLLFNTMLEAKADKLQTDYPGFFQKINNRVCKKLRFEKLKHIQFTTQPHSGGNEFKSNNLSIASFVSMAKETESEITRRRKVTCSKGAVKPLPIAYPAKLIRSHLSQGDWFPFHILCEMAGT